LKNLNLNVGAFLGDISSLIIKTIVAVLPNLMHNYLICHPKKEKMKSHCFEIFGYLALVPSGLSVFGLSVLSRQI
jgi:hypothetical protein